MYYLLFYIVHYVFFSYLWFLFVCFLLLLAFTKRMLISPILHLIRPKDSTQSLTQRIQKHCFFFFFLSDTITTSHPSLNIKIQSLNVKGLGKSIKRRSIFQWLHNQKRFYKRRTVLKNAPNSGRQSGAEKSFSVTDLRTVKEL